MMKKIVGIVGNFKLPSSTYRVVAEIAQQISQKLNMEFVIYNLSDLGPSFPMAQSANELDFQAQHIIEEIINSDILVVGVPTYNASFPGMFKHLFDLISPETLANKPVILSATGGSERHSLMIDYQLRPLFNYFKTWVTNTSIYVTSNDCIHTQPTAVLQERIQQTIDELEHFIAMKD